MQFLSVKYSITVISYISNCEVIVLKISVRVYKETFVAVFTVKNMFVGILRIPSYVIVGLFCRKDTFVRMRMSRRDQFSRGEDGSSSDSSRLDQLTHLKGY